MESKSTPPPPPPPMPDLGLPEMRRPPAKWWFTKLYRRLFQI